MMNSPVLQFFMDACSQAQVPSRESEVVGRKLLARYEEAGRHYHNLTHISKMLECLDKTGAGTLELRLAIWFHDSVYDPLAQDNEAASARYFVETMDSLLPAGTVREVVRLILATDFKRPRNGLPDEALLIDIDFSILGAPWDEYNSYRIAVREEYSAVPEPDFTTGRMGVLRHFLTGPIFTTDFFTRLEQPARRNIQRELDQLEKAGA